MVRSWTGRTPVIPILLCMPTYQAKNTIIFAALPEPNILTKAGKSTHKSNFEWMEQRQASSKQTRDPPVWEQNGPPINSKQTSPLIGQTGVGVVNDWCWWVGRDCDGGTARHGTGRQGMGTLWCTAMFSVCFFWQENSCTRLDIYFAQKRFSCTKF